MAPPTFLAPKVPQVLLTFWVVTLLTTGIGETGADFMGSRSIPIAGVVGGGGFAIAIRMQLRAASYHPIRYWLTVLMVAIFDTMIADGPSSTSTPPSFQVSRRSAGSGVRSDQHEQHPSSVVLPAPLAPSTPCTSPAATRRDTSSTARTVPADRPRRFVW